MNARNAIARLSTAVGVLGLVLLTFSLSLRGAPPESDKPDAPRRTGEQSARTGPDRVDAELQRPGGGVLRVLPPALSADYRSDGMSTARNSCGTVAIDPWPASTSAVPVVGDVAAEVAQP